MGTNVAQAHSNEGIKLALKAGVSTIEHASYIDNQIISLFLQAGAIAVSTLLASRRQVENLKEIPDYMAEKISKHLEKETDSVKKLNDEGVLIAGGTDTGTPFNPHRELVEKLKILSECGMGNLQALKAGTYVSALALGIQDYTGILKPGKIADILVVKGNPVNDLNMLKNILSVWKSGKCIIENNI
ncbi:MAG: amidohydrolase family protein [Actinobacteria bacterium]|nr:amidohydrolase family protein [Actinomycetota bacterium]